MEFEGSKKITLLGSTGSIGTQTLECCSHLGYKINALAANRSVALLEKQAREFSPRYVVVSEKESYSQLKLALHDTDIKLLAGVEGMCEAAALPENDLVVNSVVGMVGLRPTLAALQAKKTLALANKETLVAAGKLVMDTARANGVDILPVDSEHSAIFQSMQGSSSKEVHNIILTASGGPFLGKTAADLEKVTLQQALKHPNWEMGAKITIDSSTLMNKGLEFIEAMWLFHLRPDQIEVVVHPQSVVHSAVEYVDGSIIAQMGVPDMKIPIQYALTYPRRKPTPVKRLSLTEYGNLTFLKPDLDTFVCLSSCIDAVIRGGLYPCVVNSANEQAVALFLQQKISYTDIGKCVRYALDHYSCSRDRYTLEDVLFTDQQVRKMIKEYCLTP